MNSLSSNGCGLSGIFFAHAGDVPTIPRTGVPIERCASALPFKASRMGRLPLEIQEIRPRIIVHIVRESKSSPAASGNSLEIRGRDGGRVMPKCIGTEMAFADDAAPRPGHHLAWAIYLETSDRGSIHDPTTPF